MKNWKRQKPSRRRGAAVVEMAVTLPIFLVVLLGILEFGRAMMVQQLLVNGARIGVRKAILDESTNSEVEQLVDDTCQATVQATVTVTISVNGVPGADLSSANPGDLCQVNLSIPFSSVSLLPAPSWLNSQMLQATCVMEHE